MTKQDLSHEQIWKEACNDNPTKNRKPTAKEHWNNMGPGAKKRIKLRQRGERGQEPQKSP